MGRYLRQLVVPFSVGAKCRKFWLIAACILAPLSLALSEPAVAQTCAPIPNGGSLSAADPSTTCTGTFNTNINVGGPTTPPPSLLTLILAPGTTVISPGGIAVNLANVTALPPGIGTSATITANDAAITLSNPGGSDQSGLRIQAAGSATITASGIINLAGGDKTNAIFAQVFERRRRRSERGLPARPPRA